MSASDSPEKVAIGISFGNSYSSIARTTREGKAEVIANEDGDRQIPSILSYVSGQEFHGAQAKAQLVRNSGNTVAYFRDFLGQDFKSIDPTPCHQSAHPKESNGAVAFNISDSEDGDAHDVSVSEITTRHLKRLRTSASDYMGKTVNAAVVTVPTNFSDAQKAALNKAAEAAGIEVMQFIHEPIAAVLAYDARPDAKLEDKVSVVADIGGTRSDVAVVANHNGIYSILATAHDYDVAGTQLDQVLVDYFAKEFMKKNSKTTKDDPRENQRSLAKLKLESEAVKKSLSLGTSASFSVESLAAGIDFTCSVNRSRFELLASKHFGALGRLISHTVEKAELDVLDIDEIILAGGSSHTPRIASNLSSTFPSSVKVLAPSTLPSAINPSELSARGAAIQASLISEFDKEDIEQSTHPMVTATPHLSRAIGVLSISDDESRGVFSVLVKADTAVPVRRTATIATPRDGGDVLIKICEAVREIKVTKPEPKPKENGKEQGSDEEDESGFEDSDEEEEELREKQWKPGHAVAEAAIRGVKKGSKVEVQLSIGADLAMQVICREVGAKGGVRGMVKPNAENGTL